MSGADDRGSGRRGVRGRRVKRIALLAALAVVGGCAGPAPTVPPAPSTTPLPSAIAQPSAEASDGPAQPADAGWTAVRPTGLPRVANLVPTVLAGDTVARTSAFLLTSLDGQPVLDLAGRVVADPPISFAISTSSDGALLRPKTPLAAATRYQLSLTRPDGTVAAAWSAQTAGPLNVASTVPGDTATGVPRDTGIEVTFDQSGVTTTDMASHFSIAPATAGRFEASGRSVAFVPDKPLAKATLYTVTVRHGLPLGGTGETLAKDAIVRFETSSDQPASGVRVWLAEDLVDASPRERAALSLWVDVPEGATAPKTVSVTVHRLATLADAISAWKAVAAAPEWTIAAAGEAVATASLPRVVSAGAGVHELDDGTRWIQLPTKLPIGWYVVTVRYAGVPRQLVLQVTDTATYAMVTTTRTALWVNDLRTGAPAVGATATLGGVTLAGAADVQGLLVAPTPSQVVSDTSATQLLMVRYRDRSTFRPTAGACEGCRGKGGGPDSTDVDRWWTLLATDRSQYRQTDAINILGVVKGRTTGAAPAAVSLALYANESDGTGTPIQTQTATPDARGMYTARLRINELPIGGYWVRAKVGGDPVGETWLEVATIRKPAYAVAVTTAKHAVISGQPLEVAVSTTFFEGTPVAGVNLAVSANSDGPAEATLSTDTTGRATGTIHPTTTSTQFEAVSVSATPTLPEEASLAGSAQVAVFPGSDYVSLSGTVSGSKVTVRGAVNVVAFGRYENAEGDLSAVDPRGDPRPGAAVRVVVVARYLQVRKVGTTYDFITKRVQPKYESIDRSFTLPARTVRTAADGTFRLVVSTTHNAYAYEITATTRDAAGREIRADSWTESPSRMASPLDPPTIRAIDGHGSNQTYAVGDTVRVRFTAPATTATQRYLFLTLQQGLREAAVRSGSTFATPFASTSVPDIAIGAVRFNGNGYDVVRWLYTARLDPASRTMSVSATADKARYQPGDTATVTVRTLDPAGHPVAASVFVRAIDEKLYALGAATDDDPVPSLYSDVPSGLITMTWSHRIPGNQGGGGGGDTGGGGAGGRTDFRDWLVAKVVHTDTNGRATVQIPLSDDLTSWRVAATAVDSRLNAGATSVKLPVGLPFFVDAVIAPEYLAADRPVIRVRSFGTALPTGTRVTFAISSDTLPMPEATVAADAFASAYVPLPELSVGTHRLRIAASAVVDGRRLSDAMVRTFTVVAHRATQLRTTWSPLTGTTRIKAGAGLTSVVMVDAGRGRVVPILEELAWPGAVRSDDELASALANRVLQAQFGLPAVTQPQPNGLDVYSSSGGISIVSWGSPQLDVTALAAMAGDPRVLPASIRPLLTDVAANPEQARARRLLALAGLAALGEPVRDQIREAAKQTNLTVEEQVQLALAALAAGDEDLAGRVEQQVLARAGFRSGDQVRIDPGPAADATVVTARLAIVAASLGDPVAAELDAYVAAHPSKTTLVTLERALAARGWAMRVAAAPASAALTVGGTRREVTLPAGRAVAEALTPAQVASATIDPVSGSVLVVQTWDEALTPQSLTTPKGVSVVRTVSPAGVIAADATVVVRYTVTIPEDARDACWRLADSVPSGLAPIPWYGAMAETDSLPGDVPPTFVDGQRVEFCVGWSNDRSEYALRYVARVVTPGTYAWEPVVLQSTTDPATGVSGPATTLKIATPGS